MSNTLHQDPKTSHVLYRNLHKNYASITHGQGLYLYDKSGRQYLDASGGAYVCSLGHGRSDLNRAISEQLNRVAYVNGMHFSSEPLEQLAERFFKLSKGRWCKSFLPSSGSEAIEAAVKLARQHWVSRGLINKYKILSRDPSYHGNTLFALSISARRSYKELYGPLLSSNYTVETPYTYRSAVDYQNLGAQHYAAQFEKLILKEGADTVAAIVLEPISGSSAGGSCPPPHYLEEVQKIAQRHDVLLISDEVLVGAGRTGEFFAGDHYGFHPDIVVLGKSLNAGAIPASAVLCSNAVIESITLKGSFLHAQTYMHHPAAAACCLAVLNIFEKENLLDNVQRMGRLMHELLNKELLNHPHVGFITGKGLLAGIELVENKDSKQSYARNMQVAEKFREWALSQGLVVWIQSGQLKDGSGDIVLIAPPFIVRPEDLALIVSKLKKALFSFFEEHLKVK